MDKSRKKNIIIFILFLIFLACYYINDYNDKKIVLSSYRITKGKIIDYNLVGVESTNYLKYEYTVDNKKYTRTINPIIKKYDYCQDNIEHCKRKDFWVIYSRRFPSKSLINLRYEIQGRKNPVFPKTLDDFQ